MEQTFITIAEQTTAEFIIMIILMIGATAGILYWCFKPEHVKTNDEIVAELQRIDEEHGGHGRKQREFKDRQDAWLKSFMKKHAGELIKHRHNTVSVDKYGVADLTPMRSEAKYFIKNVYIPAHKKWMEGQPEMDVYLYASDEEKTQNAEWVRLKEEFVVDLTEELYAAPSTQKQIKEAYSKDEECPEDPFEFEAFCSRILERKGWTAKATQGSGDQGADVIGTKGEYKVIIQCKKYSKPVGNKAVQEVIAAKGFFHGTHALVVNSDGEFTKSAKELAVMSNVELMHYNELKEWEPSDEDSRKLV